MVFLVLILNICVNIACKNAIREQKLRLELSAAKKERDFYLNKVEKSRALFEIEERMKKVCGVWTKFFSFTCC